MSFETSLFGFIDRLNNANISYMICGSVASGFYGEARTTQDVDIVVAPPTSQLLTFIAELGPAYYASEAAAREALANKSMFNIIDLDEGLKFDLIICDDRPFSREEFRRRVDHSIFNRNIVLATAEDTILSKLVWNQITASERQLRDVQQMILVQADKLDRAYLENWATQLRVKEQLDRMLN
jgi:hypothetical protein